MFGSRIDSDRALSIARWVFLFFIVTVAVIFIKSAPNVYGDGCKDAVVVFARGSGQPGRLYGDSEFNIDNRLKEAALFLDSIPTKVGNGYSFEQYNLTQFEKHYNARGYVAVNVGPWGQPLVNSASAEWTIARLTGGDYPQSVEDGVQELTGFLEDRVVECPDQKIVLGGYSQGAQVVGETLWRLPKNVGNKLTFVALFGDPKFNPGPIYQANPNARFLSLAQMKTIADPSFKSHELGQAQAAQAPWLRGDFEYAKYGGALDTRNPYIPDYLYGRVGSWCNAGDFVCSSVVSPANIHAHQHYSDVWIPQATDEIAARLKSALEARELLKSQEQLSLQQEHQKPTDIMLVREVTPNMAKVNSSIQGWAKNYTKAILREYPNARIGVTQYCDIGKYVVNPFVAKQTMSFTSNFDDIVKGIQYIEPGCKNSDGTAAALLSGIDMALSADWNSDSVKKIVVMNMEPARDWDPSNLKSVEPLTGLSVDGEIAKTVAKDISISVLQQPVYNQATAHMQLIRFVNGTNGRYDESGGEIIVQPLRDILEFQFTNPVAVIQGPYTGSVSNQYAKDFNSATSSSSSTTIKEYRWDFNDDGIIDRVTGTVGNLSSGAWDYTDKGYIGLARLYVVNQDNATDSDTVSIYLPGKPTTKTPIEAPVVSISPRSKDGLSLHVSWQYQPNVLGYRVSFADTGYPLAYVDGSATTIDLVNIPRGEGGKLLVTAMTVDSVSTPTSVDVPQGPELLAPLSPVVDEASWLDLHHLKLTWHLPDDSDPADTYVVAIEGQIIYEGPDTTTVIADENISSATEMQLTSHNSAGTSKTTFVSIPDLPPPDAPTLFTAIWPDSGTLVFSWFPSVIQTFVEGYRLMDEHGLIGSLGSSIVSHEYKVATQGIGGVYSLLSFNRSATSPALQLLVDNFPFRETPIPPTDDSGVDETSRIPLPPRAFTVRGLAKGVVRFTWDTPSDVSAIDGYKILDAHDNVVAILPANTTTYDYSNLDVVYDVRYGIESYNTTGHSDILSASLLTDFVRVANEPNPPDKGQTLDQTNNLPPAPPQPNEIQLGAPASSGSTYNQQQGISPQVLGNSTTENSSISPQNAGVVDPQTIQGSIKGEGMQSVQVHSGGLSFWWVMSIAALLIVLIALYQRFARTKPKD